MPLQLDVLLDDLATRIADKVTAKLRTAPISATAAPAPEFLTVDAAATTLGWTPRAVRAAVAAGKLKASRPGGGRRLSIARADLEAFQRGGGAGAAAAPDIEELARQTLAKGRR